MTEFITDIINFLITFAFWYFIWSVALYFVKEHLNSKNNEHQQVVDQVSKMVHAIKEEEHGDMKYWFDRDSDEFLAQGKTYTDIVAHLKSRFPGHLFLLSENKMLAGPDYNIVDIDPENIYKSIYSNKK
jgi:hypothetical protein